MKLLIIDNYDSFTYNVVQLIEQAGVMDYQIIKNNKLFEVKAEDFNRIIISPGPGIASESGMLMWFLEKYYKTKPILGICLGFEAIAELFGGKLIHLSSPMHGIKNNATIIIRNGIFKGIPTNFSIGHYHSWIVDEASLPKELDIILKDENNIIMAISHVKYNIIGLQFHPESIMTEYGLKLISNWLALH